MKKVGIVMGSDSDMPVMSKAAAILDKLGVEYEMKIISAHREPDVFFDYAKSASEYRLPAWGKSPRTFPADELPFPHLQ